MSKPLFPSRPPAHAAHIPLILAAMLTGVMALTGCTPKDINPIRYIDPHPGLPGRATATPMPLPTGPTVTMPPRAETESGPTPADVEGDQAEALLAGDPWALRFLALRRLVQENLMPLSEAQARSDANLGALLPLTQPPAPVGLDRPIPPIARIVAEIRSVPPGSPQLAFLEDQILPLTSGTRLALNPHTQQAARRLQDRLERLRQTGLVAPQDAQREAEALTALLASNRLPETDLPPPPPPEKPKPKPQGGKGGLRPHRGPEPMFVDDPANFEPPKLEPNATGEAGIELMSIPDPKQGDKAWTTLKTQYPELAPLPNKLVRTDLGDVGVTWRIVAGPLPPADAVKMCETLKAKGQQCIPTPFPK